MLVAPVSSKGSFEADDAGRLAIIANTFARAGAQTAPCPSTRWRGKRFSAGLLLSGALTMISWRGRSVQRPGGLALLLLASGSSRCDGPRPPRSGSDDGILSAPSY